MKKHALLLCLVTLPLFAQSSQQPPMAGMSMGKMDKMDHSSPPQLSVPPPELLQEIGRAHV